MRLVRQFVDTNVVVYAHDVSAGPKRERARELLGDLWRDGNGALSIQVLQEFFVVATRKVPRPLDWQEASRVVSLLGQMAVHVPVVDDVVGAIEIAAEARISFWDAMVIRSAAELGSGVLWSEDLTTEATYRGVRVSNPFLPG